MRILGVDPGSRLTGYGAIDLIGNQLRHVTHGTLRLSNTSGRAEIPLENRLYSIYEGLTEIILQYRPQILVVEKVFFAKNAVSSLKLGQARGAVILTGMIHHLSIHEYSPTQVKQVVVGHGQAEKEQVAKMVKILTGCPEFSTYDASDALALAICHAHSSAHQAGRKSQFEALQAASSQRRKKKMSLAEAVGHRAQSPAERKKS